MHSIRWRRPGRHPARPPGAECDGRSEDRTLTTEDSRHERGPRTTADSCSSIDEQKRSPSPASLLSWTISVSGSRLAADDSFAGRTRKGRA
jgi:hypothetical protein